MSRLVERVKKLESSKDGNSNAVDCVIVTSFIGIDEKDKEAKRLRGYGMSFERLDSESEDDFIERAKAEVRAAGHDQPVLMLFAN